MGAPRPRPPPRPRPARRPTPGGRRPTAGDESAAAGDAAAEAAAPANATEADGRRREAADAEPNRGGQDMSAGSARLKHALKNLREHWDITREKWHDSVARDFEKNHLIPLDQQVNNALRGMDKISEVLQKVRHDCS